MQNVKFRCVLALSAAGAKKNQTIMSFTTLSMAQYIVPLEEEICENM